jgi:hypothetical protein
MTTTNVVAKITTPNGRRQMPAPLAPMLTKPDVTLADCIEAARDYLAMLSPETADAIREATPEQVSFAIDRVYLGGWKCFRMDCEFQLSAE